MEINMQDKIQILDQIKGFDFGEMAARLWVVKKNTRSGKNTYKTLQADVSGLDADFKVTLKKFFCGEANVVEPINNLAAYSALTNAVDEDRALVHSVEDTDFTDIITRIQNGADNEPVTDINEFHNAWALVIEFTTGVNKLGD
jgi:hypothetical protein